jgi:hypothetical protein
MRDRQLLTCLCYRSAYEVAKAYFIRAEEAK